MKYLRKFNTEADVMMFDSPNVVLVADSGKVMYNVPSPKGVYIQHINGGLFTTDAWTAGGFANDEANGVAVISDNAKFVIAKTSLGKMAWSSDTSNAVEGVMLTNESAIAGTDYAGAANTALIAVDDTSGAALACANFTFPNGANGYLPALGEWVDAYAYKADVDAAMILIGGAGISGSHWSSTQYSATIAWRKDWSYSTTNGGNKSLKYDIAVRAFSAL
jgi:hypothetical protein